jgi:hypothetical protein
VGAERLAYSPLTIIFPGERIYESIHTWTVVEYEPSRMGNVPQAHPHVTHSIINREGTLIEVKWFLRQNMI